MRKRKYTRYVGVLVSEETFQDMVRITDSYEMTISEFLRNIVVEKIDCIGKGHKNGKQ